MQRIKEGFLDKLETVVLLKGKKVLEIGCGEGSRSTDIAKRCKELTAIEPDAEKIKIAQASSPSSVIFEKGVAEHLEFDDHSFDMVIFTLSLHHVPTDKIAVAIDEAARVVKKEGCIAFLEPTDDGTLFDAEIQFEAWDGDERKQKAAAYQAMLAHPKLSSVKEIDDETIFQFDSVDDFVESTTPKKNLEELPKFLENNNYILRAGRRINVFQVK